MMRSSVSIAVVLILGAMLTCCGQLSLILLEVHAPYSIPDQVDMIDITVRSAGEATQLLHITSALVAGHTFPFEILLEPSDETPKSIEEEIVVSLGGTPVAQVTVRHDWVDGSLNRVTVPELTPVTP